MADQEKPEIRVQVANARPEDSGRGIAHLPRAMMAQLGLAEGDVIEIIGKRNTPSRVVGPYPEDEGLDLLRLDGLATANAGLAGVPGADVGIECGLRLGNPVGYSLDRLPALAGHFPFGLLLRLPVGASLALGTDWRAHGLHRPHRHEFPTALAACLRVDGSLDHGSAFRY